MMVRRGHRHPTSVLSSNMAPRQPYGRFLRRSLSRSSDSGGCVADSAGWGDSGSTKAHDQAPSEKMSDGKSGLISNEFQVEVRTERLGPGPGSRG